jgi:hypothetical protein
MPVLTNDAKKSKHQLMVEVFMAKMRSDKQAIPTAPMIPSLEIRKLRASLMLEECLETIREGLGIHVVHDLSNIVMAEGDKFRFEEDKTRKPNLIQIADGLCDQRVVNDGTGAACGLALEPLEFIVSANNLMKFGPGHSFNELGKLVKPPDFIGPFTDLARELREQGADSEKLSDDLDRCLK